VLKHVPADWHTIVEPKLQRRHEWYTDPGAFLTRYFSAEAVQAREAAALTIDQFLAMVAKKEQQEELTAEQRELATRAFQMPLEECK
jgi:hypothetical protein